MLSNLYPINIKSPNEVGNLISLTCKRIIKKYSTSEESQDKKENI